ncbi:hypothetical protein Tco_0904702 [Tanacetum coccineum]
MEVFHDLRGDYRVVYHDLCLGGQTLAERKNVGLDLTKTLIRREDLPAHKRGVHPSFSFTLSIPLSICFSNLRLRLNQFFCDVLQYFHIHISRLNPFGCAKLTTFIVMCKAYGCEPSVDLFRGFFYSFPGVKWLTFAKRPEKHIPNLLPKVITLIEGWKGRFFFVQDSVVLLIVQSFSLRIIDGIRKMAFRNFMYAETSDDLTFLPMGPSLEFGTGSPSISINTKPPIAKVGPTGQLVENTADDIK